MSRNRASAKKAGTSWESEIVRALIAAGWPYAERRRLNGSYDRGDIAGVAGVVIEAKNTKAIDLAGALNEAIAEGVTANAAVAVAWIKKRGTASADGGYVVMDGHQFMQLLKKAGYQ